MKTAWMFLVLAAGASADQTDKYIEAHLKRLKARSSLDRTIGANGLGSIGSRSAAALPKLTEMLKADPDPMVRRAVAASLPQISPDAVQDALFEAARGDSDPSVRETAAQGLRDDARLAVVVREEKDDALRRRAARRLSDVALIALATDAPLEVRRDALMFLKDQEAVAKLARTLASAEARRDAVAALHPGPALADIAKQDPDASVREWALLVAKAKGRKDLTLDKMDCKRAGSSNAECQITLTNHGPVAYEAIEYDSDMGTFGLETRDKAGIGTRSYLAGVLEPGVSRSETVGFYLNPYSTSVAIGITGCRSVPPQAK